jgi:hypothetical protein
MVALARERGLRTVFVPAIDVREAALVEGTTLYPVTSLAELVDHLRGAAPIAPFTVGSLDELGYATPYEGTDLAEIRGQEHAKRALEIAAYGLPGEGWSSEEQEIRFETVAPRVRSHPSRRTDPEPSVRNRAAPQRTR